MSEFSVTISINDQTLTFLNKADYSLYALRSVISSNRSGFPLVAFTTKEFTTTTRIIWTDSISGFISTDSLPDDPASAEKHTPIAIGDAKPIHCGQIMEVDQALVSKVVDGGYADTISFNSNYHHAVITCGLADTTETTGGATKLSPLCAFPLAGGLQVTVRPKLDLFLMFATSEFGVGSWLQFSFGEGALITSGKPSELKVTYDMGNWTADAGTSCKTYEAGTNLCDLLIVKPEPYVPTV